MQRITYDWCLAKGSSLLDFELIFQIGKGLAGVGVGRDGGLRGATVEHATSVVHVFLSQEFQTLELLAFRIHLLDFKVIVTGVCSLSLQTFVSSPPLDLLLSSSDCPTSGSQ